MSPVRSRVPRPQEVRFCSALRDPLCVSCDTQLGIIVLPSWFWGILLEIGARHGGHDIHTCSEGSHPVAGCADPADTRKLCNGVIESLSKSDKGTTSHVP